MRSFLAFLALHLAKGSVALDELSLLQLRPDLSEASSTNVLTDATASDVQTEGTTNVLTDATASDVQTEETAEDDGHRRRLLEDEAEQQIEAESKEVGNADDEEHVNTQCRRRSGCAERRRKWQRRLLEDEAEQQIDAESKEVGNADDEEHVNTQCRRRSGCSERRRKWQRRLLEDEDEDDIPRRVRRAVRRRRLVEDEDEDDIPRRVRRAVRRRRLLDDEDEFATDDELDDNGPHVKRARAKFCRKHPHSKICERLLLEDEDEQEADDNVDFEAAKLHRRRRGKKFGHGVVKAAKVAKKVYDHPVGKAAITAAVAR